MKISCPRTSSMEVKTGAHAPSDSLTMAFSSSGRYSRVSGRTRLERCTAVDEAPNEDHLLELATCGNSAIRCASEARDLGLLLPGLSIVALHLVTLLHRTNVRPGESAQAPIPRYDILVG